VTLEVLVFGAIYSAYVYMPKRKVLRAKARIPVLAQLYGAAAVAVKLAASLPAATGTLLKGKLNSRVPATILIAAGAFIPGVTSGLNRFGIPWSFFLGEFLGVLLIFAGFLVSEEVFRNIRIGGSGHEPHRKESWRPTPVRTEVRPLRRGCAVWCSSDRGTDPTTGSTVAGMARATRSQFALADRTPPTVT
jgi:hypothetical protein